MDPLSIALIVIALVIVQIIGLSIVFGWLKRQNAKPEDNSSLMLIQQQMQELTRTLDSRVSESTKAMQESAHRQITESNRVVRDVTDRLAKLDETNRQVVSFADQLQNLQDVLQNP
ncbi:MAG TPA: DNA recombination protein RmuC, partial [Candidatus Paceibacterota bacterium]|nr:DNA recombination protein RmuC [Candidatus Paceibacterota bacterium]